MTASAKFAAERGQWLDQLAADNRMSAAAYRAALMICHYYNGKERKAWASADRMSQDYDIDRTGIIRGIQKLEELGHLRIDRKGGCNGSEYFWVLSGRKIVSKPKDWKTRHRTSNGAKPSTIQKAESDAAYGGRSNTIMVDGLNRNGAKPSTLTPDRTLEGTLEDGAARQAGPIRSVASASTVVEDLSCDGSDRQSVPDAALEAAGTSDQQDPSEIVAEASAQLSDAKGSIASTLAPSPASPEPASAEILGDRYFAGDGLPDPDDDWFEHPEAERRRDRRDAALLAGRLVTSAGERFAQPLLPPSVSKLFESRLALLWSIATALEAGDDEKRIRRRSEELRQRAVAEGFDESESLNVDEFIVRTGLAELRRRKAEAEEAALTRAGGSLEPKALNQGRSEKNG